MVGSLSPFATSGLGRKPPPPVPVKATDLGLSARVDFDRLLVVAPLDPGNWSVRVNNLRHAVSAAGAGPPGFPSVTITYQPPGFPDVGPPVVTYNPPPFDVVGDPDLVPAAAFTDYPITP